MAVTTIPGYTSGTDKVPRSPVSRDEVELIKATLLFGEDDRDALRSSSEIPGPQIEAILDVWYGFVGCQPPPAGRLHGP
jgi:hypothetical protein